MQEEATAQKFLRGSINETKFSNADDRNGRNKAGQNKSTNFKSSALQKKGSKGITFDMEQQVCYKIKIIFLCDAFFCTFETSLKSPIWLTMNMVPSQKKLISFEHGLPTPQT